MVVDIYENKQYPEVEMPACPIEKKLKGQTAIVTGATSGIGKDIAIAMGRAGANVIINYISGNEVLKEMIPEIEKCGGKAIGFQADVSNESQVQAMFEKAREEYGTVDILVNNAGLQQDAAFDEMTLAQWQKVIDVNLTGQFLCAIERVSAYWLLPVLLGSPLALPHRKRSGIFLPVSSLPSHSLSAWMMSLLSKESGEE